MSEMIQSGFDYATLPVDVALKAQLAANSIKLRLKRTVEDIIEIGRELTAVKVDLPHGSYYQWLSAEFEMSRQTADNFESVYARFGGDKTLKFSVFKPSILYALAAPSTPETVVEKAIEKAESGEKVTIADVKDWKTEFELERQARLDTERMKDAFREESNERRKKIRELETQIDLLKTKPAPEPVIQTVIKEVEKPVIPPEFASLEEAMTAKQAEINRLMVETKDWEKKRESALALNHSAYEALRHLQEEKKELEVLLSRHKAAEREMIEHKRLTDNAVHFCANFVADLRCLEHAPDPEQYRRWQQTQQILQDAAAAIQIHLHELDSSPTHALEGELLEAA